MLQMYTGKSSFGDDFEIYNYLSNISFTVVLFRETNWRKRLLVLNTCNQ